MSGCAKVEWTVDKALEYAEDPNSVTRSSERVLALEVRRLRKEAIDQANDAWDWQRRALEAEEKLAERDVAALKTQQVDLSQYAHVSTADVPDVGDRYWRKPRT